VPNLLTPLPFLDASGQPANGFIFAQATRTFSTAGGFITTARSMGRVVNGVFLTADDSKSDPFVLVTATVDAPLSIVIKLDSYTTDGRLVKDGGGVASRTVTVPDVGTVTWLDLVDVVAVADAVPYVIQPWMQDAMDNAAAASASAATATTKAGEAAASAASVVRGGANGVAPLDGSSKVPDANLPTRLGASELSTTIDDAIAAVPVTYTLLSMAAPGEEGGSLATLSGAPVFTSAGKFGTCLTAGSVAATGKVPQPTTGTVTVEGWVKLAAPPTGIKVALSLGSANYAAAAATTGYAILTLTGVTVSSAINVCDGAWHHIAYELGYAGGKPVFVGFWVDGASVAGSPANPVNAWEPDLRVGGFQSATTYQWPGSLDEVRVSTGPRYTGTFALPTAAFVWDSSTLVIEHLDSTAYSFFGTGSGYPARPASALDGAVTYIGPTQPAGWLTYDRWIQA